MIVLQQMLFIVLAEQSAVNFYEKKHSFWRVIHKFSLILTGPSRVVVILHIFLLIFIGPGGNLLIFYIMLTGPGRVLFFFSIFMSYCCSTSNQIFFYADWSWRKSAEIFNYTDCSWWNSAHFFLIFTSPGHFFVLTSS